VAPPARAGLSHGEPPSRAGRLRGHEPFIRLRGWHANVDDSDIQVCVDAF